MSLKEIQADEEIEEEINELEEKEVIEPVISIKKVKKPRSQKQIESFEKAKIKLAENNKLRNEAKKQMIEETKKSFEGKIVKKALEIKKKEILRESILDDISDEDTDTDLQKIKKIIKKKAIKQFPPVDNTPKIIYV